VGNLPPSGDALDRFTPQVAYLRVDPEESMP
jgi:hypothetical protein